MMLLALLLASGQATEPAAAPQSWSILNPPDCPVARDGDHTIVVCAPDAKSGARLPLPDDRGPPDHGIPSNPNRTGIGALSVEGTPCAASQRGCSSSFGPPIAPIVAGAVALAKSAFAKKPDKSGRIPIDLGDPPARTVTR